MPSESAPRPGIRYRAAEVRALPDVGEGVVEAYVTVYGVPYSIGFGTKEVIEAGAFDDSIAENPKIPIFWQHGWRDAGQIIGDGVASSDDKGVRVQAQLYMDSEGPRNVYRSIQAGSIREWSIGYRDQLIEWDEDDEDLIHIHTGELIEASSVVRGANPDTETIEVRSGFVVPQAVLDTSGNLVWRYASTTTSSGPDPDPEPDPEPEPEPEVHPDLAERLSEPWVRDLLRERLSSSPPQSSE